MKRLVLLFALFVALATGGCDRHSADESPPPPQEPEEAATSPDDDDSGTEDDDPEETSDGPLGPDDIAVTDPGTIERSLLWRVDGPEGPVWLFGTVHGGVDASNWNTLPADVQRAIEASEIIALEVDLDTIAGSPKLMEYTMLPQGESLRDDLGEEYWEILTTLLAVPPTGPGPEAFQPWMAYSLFVMAMIQDGGMVDEAVAEHARQRGLEFDFIETAEEQLAILSDLFDVAYLQAVLDDPLYYRDGLQRVLDAYVVGDAETIAEVVFEAEHLEEFPEVYERLYVERNRNWIPDIEEYIERGDVFVAVGVGHLVGDDSVVAMLEDEGYDVVRVDED